MPKHSEYLFEINGHQFVDMVGTRKAYALSAKTDCYRLHISKADPYSADRQDWEEVSWDKLPKWVRDRFEEVEPLLAIMRTQ
mgnify:FL=1